MYIRGHCQCHQGWKGRECEIRENQCEVPTCNGNGRCIDGKCVCHTGFQGPDCGIGECWNQSLLTGYAVVLVLQVVTVL